MPYRGALPFPARRGGACQAHPVAGHLGYAGVVPTAVPPASAPWRLRIPLRSGIIRVRRVAAKRKGTDMTMMIMLGMVAAAMLLAAMAHTWVSEAASRDEVRRVDARIAARRQRASARY